MGGRNQTLEIRLYGPGNGFFRNIRGTYLAKVLSQGSDNPSDAIELRERSRKGLVDLIVKNVHVGEEDCLNVGVYLSFIPPHWLGGADNGDYNSAISALRAHYKNIGIVGYNS